MAKPDEEKLAKVVLYHLASVRAEISAIEVRMATLEARLGGAVPSAEAQRQWKERTRTLQANLYAEACKEAGLQINTPPIFPPEARSDTE